VRLRERYHHLVAEHLSPTDAIAAGLRALPGQGTAFASTQAAWRFYANPDVTPPVLVAPLLNASRTLSADADHFALVVHDICVLDYTAHSGKSDRLWIRRTVRGYRLLTALLLSDHDGMPLSVLSMSLWAKDGIHTTRSAAVAPKVVNLDEVTASMDAIAGCGLTKPAVSIIDREADSIGHLRRWHEREHRYVIRARRSPKAEFEGEALSLGAIAERLTVRPSEAVDLGTGLVGQQFVAEGPITIRRAGRPTRQPGGRRAKRTYVAGPPIHVRLVVSQVRAPDERVVAEWLLLTNLGPEVSAETIARWYVWRWKIESYFKLAKSAGHHVEHWQQETADAVLKRLLVTAMAAVVVWQVARAKGAEAEATRALLVRLSGRQMRRERPWTEPALLAGLWVLLSMLDALETYSLDELRRIARRATLGVVRYSSSPDDTS
jgi:hypothetical protein